MVVIWVGEVLNIFLTSGENNVEQTAQEMSVNQK